MKTGLFIFISVFTSSGFLFAQTQKVILYDDFSINKNNWPVYSVKRVNYLIYNGKLVIDVQDSLTYNVTIGVNLKTENNYSIVLTATHSNGVDDRGYGLFFGGSDIIS
jgi:hypothetical protein